MCVPQIIKKYFLHKVWFFRRPTHNRVFNILWAYELLAWLESGGVMSMNYELQIFSDSRLWGMSMRVLINMSPLITRKLITLENPGAISKLVPPYYILIHMYSYYDYYIGPLNFLSLVPLKKSWSSKFYMDWSSKNGGSVVGPTYFRNQNYIWELLQKITYYLLLLY